MELFEKIKANVAPETIIKELELSKPFLWGELWRIQAEVERHLEDMHSEEIFAARRRRIMDDAWEASLHELSRARRAPSPMMISTDGGYTHMPASEYYRRESLRDERLNAKLARHPQPGIGEAVLEVLALPGRILTGAI